MHPALLPAGTQIRAGLGVSTVLADIDFECYSEAGCTYDVAGSKWVGATKGKKGLPVVGAAVYATHPTTEVLSLAYNLKDGRGPRLWRPGMPPPSDLFEHVGSDGLLEAWNAAFEWWIWNYVCVRLGWPALPIGQMRCAQAKARAASYPGKLEIAGEVMKLSTQKDTEGARLLKLLSMPRNPTRGDWRLRNFPADMPEEYEALYRYNLRDIEAEAEASSRCPDLEGEELDFWIIDQHINRRGVAVDAENLHACASIVEQCLKHYDAELHQLTGGVVERASQLERLKGWLAGRGFRVGVMDDDAIGSYLECTDAVGDVRRALELRRLVGSASVKKVFAMRNQLSPWGRLHDLFNYHGAHTGRPTGDGPQPQNLPKAGPKVMRCLCGRHSGAKHTECLWCAMPFPPGRKPAEWGPAAMEDVLEVVRRGRLEGVEEAFGDAMLCVSGCLRGLFVAAPGHDLIASDFSSIEGVVIACLAGEAWRIEMFATHGKAYELSASKITGIPFAEIMAHAGYADVERSEWWKHRAAVLPHHPLRQGVGKISELASGFGGWIGAWKAFGADAFMSDEEIKAAILAWRAASPAIVEFWGGQVRREGYGRLRQERFGLEGAALNAIEHPGEWFQVGASGVAYFCDAVEDALYCRLPSGRNLTYRRPRLRVSEREWAGRWQITFERYNTNPAYGAMGWTRMDTYSGKLCIAAETLVLTRRGWVRIDQVTGVDSVFDGVEWVRCDGSICNGVRPVIEAFGARMTPDHLVLTEEGWRDASQSAGHNRAACRLPDGIAIPRQRRGEIPMGSGLHLRARNFVRPLGVTEASESRNTSFLRMPALGIDRRETDYARHEYASSLRCMAIDESAMPKPEAPRLGELRRPWRYRLRRMAEIFFHVLGRHGAGIRKRFGNRSPGQHAGLQCDQLPMGFGQNPIPEQAHKCDAGRENDSADRRRVWDKAIDGILPSEARVYDLINCGPRHRFVIWAGGAPLIVHNCENVVQAVARDIQRHAMVNLEAAGYPIVLHVYDEDVVEVPKGFGSIEEVERIMGTMPTWAAGWPIHAAGGWRGKRYNKG